MNDFYTHYYFEQGGYELENRFPELLRKSLFMSCYSRFEIELIDLCKFLKEKKGLKLSLRDLSDEGIIKAQTYLKKVACVDFPDGNSPEWGQILMYNVLRNSIVHNNSVLNEDRNRDGVKKVKGFAQKSSHFEINEKNEIRLNRDFSIEFLKTTELFLDKLYEPISKSPFTFVVENEEDNDSLPF